MPRPLFLKKKLNIPMITSFDKVLEKCPLCSSPKIKPFANWTFKKIPLQYQQCHSCGFIFQNPTYSAASWGKFYKTDYRALYNDDSKPAAEVIKIQNDRADHYSQWLSNLNGKVKSHLDIGSSAGIFLKKIKDSFGVVKSTGVEPGDDYRQFASENGFDIFEDIDQLIESKPEKYDLITLCHVLEHIPDMVDFLKKIRAHLLSENGFLFIEVPNIRGGQSFEIAHPNCFSHKTLNDVLEMAGFKMVRHAEHGMPRTNHKESKIYLSSLSTPSEKQAEKASLASSEYLDSSLNHIRKGFTLDSWTMFWLKYPIKKLLGKFPV